MDSRPLQDPAILARLSVRTDGAARSKALELAGAHALRVAPDGQMDFDDPRAIERALFARPGSLVTSRKAWEARLDEDGVRARRRAYATLSWPGSRMQVEYALRDAQDGARHMREIMEAVSAGPNGALLFQGVLIDRTDEVAERQRTVWSARHDTVTGLENRATLIERGTTLAALAGRAQMTAHLLRLRIDNLSEVIAVYGPETGDRLLMQFARRLEDVVRLPDAIGRLSDADIGLCLLGADIEAITRRLQAELSDTPYNTPFGPLYLDMDSHAVPLSRLPDGMEDALARSRAVLDGGEDAMRPASVRTTQATDVIAALDEDRISLAFQPIVDARNHAVHHHECLLRLHSADGRVISAGAIVQDAERLGLIDRLDQRALDLAVPHLTRNPQIHLALNVSAGTLGDPSTANAYVDRLRELGPMAGRITLEMTETLAVDDPAAAARFSAEVRALGCRFAVDDFGSGYTTFRNLMAVEADAIKIDGTLIRGIATDENKQTFMRMMVDLAQTFSVKTVAEMVETDADAAILRRLGADYLQGYHFGRPAPSPVWSRMAG